MTQKEWIPDVESPATLGSRMTKRLDCFTTLGMTKRRKRGFDRRFYKILVAVVAATFMVFRDQGSVLAEWMKRS